MRRSFLIGPSLVNLLQDALGRPARANGTTQDAGRCVLVRSSEGELLAYARVVYRQAFSNATFAIGLELPARTGAWITG